MSQSQDGRDRYEHEPVEDPYKELDEAHKALREEFPQLDWDGPVSDVVSRALTEGFEYGRDYGNRYPE